MECDRDALIRYGNTARKADEEISYCNGSPACHPRPPRVRQALKDLLALDASVGEHYLFLPSTPATVQALGQRPLGPPSVRPWQWICSAKHTARWWLK